MGSSLKAGSSNFDGFEEKWKAITEDVNLETPKEPNTVRVSASLSSGKSERMQGVSAIDGKRTGG